MMYCKIEDNICTGDHSDCIVSWWSFGKTVLATGILKLVEQNKLDLDTKYFNNEATLIQVLRHEAGYGDYGYGPVYKKAVDNKERPGTFDKMIEITDNNNLMFESGANWRYSNIGYYHLKILIEKTMKLSISEALNILVFRPIGIHDVIVAEAKEDLKTCTYVRDDYHPKWLYHGMVVGTLKRACQFLNRLSQGRIISENMLKIMQNVYELDFDMGKRPWKKPGYALGLMLDNRQDTKYSYGHTGMGPDSVISIYHFPKMNSPKTIGVVMNTADQNEVENRIHSLL